MHTFNSSQSIRPTLPLLDNFITTCFTLFPPFSLELRNDFITGLLLFIGKVGATRCITRNEIDKWTLLIVSAEEKERENTLQIIKKENYDLFWEKHFFGLTLVKCFPIIRKDKNLQTQAFCESQTKWVNERSTEPPYEIKKKVSESDYTRLSYWSRQLEITIPRLIVQKIPESHLLFEEQTTRGSSIFRFSSGPVRIPFEFKWNVTLYVDTNAPPSFTPYGDLGSVEVIYFEKLSQHKDLFEKTFSTYASREWTYFVQFCVEEWIKWNQKQIIRTFSDTQQTLQKLFKLSETNASLQRLSLVEMCQRFCTFYELLFEKLSNFMIPQECQKLVSSYIEIDSGNISNSYALENLRTKPKNQKKKIKTKRRGDGHQQI